MNGRPALWESSRSLGVNDIIEGDFVATSELPTGTFIAAFAPRRKYHLEVYEQLYDLIKLLLRNGSLQMSVFAKINSGIGYFFSSRDRWVSKQIFLALESPDMSSYNFILSLIRTDGGKVNY